MPANQAVPVTISLPRRVLDVVVAALALVLLLPVLLVAALAILLTDGRPLFHRAMRVGEGGRPFRLPKLRTMRVGPAGPGVTTADDARVTRVGRFLRRTSIDELPQLWSVLRGRMTLVGPRPEGVELAERYAEEFRWVLQARPGLTGPAQLRYRERAATPPPGWDVEAWYLDVLVPLRVGADREYLARATFLQTLRYLVLTALFVVGLRDSSAESVPAPPLGARVVPPEPATTSRTTRGSHHASEQ